MDGMKLISNLIEMYGFVSYLLLLAPSHDNPKVTFSARLVPNCCCWQLQQRRAAQRRAELAVDAGLDAAVFAAVAKQEAALEAVNLAILSTFW